MKMVAALLLCLNACALRDPFELPLQKSAVQVRLKAIVSVNDGCCQALIEYGGAIHCVKTGDRVGDWIVQKVNSQQLTLENKQFKIVKHILLEDSAKN